VTTTGYKKLINDPFDAVDEALEGFAAAHADIVALAEPRVVVRRTPAASKVGLVVGGGSGHEPAFAGYVGAGIADAAACGTSSPRRRRTWSSRPSMQPATDEAS
jgi:dihydroxyacetone kinase